MTARDLIRSLPADPTLAYGELTGALLYGEWSEEDRVRLEKVKTSADKRRRASR